MTPAVAGQGGTDDTGEPMSEPFERGVALFNRRAYFECHEVWEDLLQAASEARDRKFLEAMIQVAAALHLRFERGGGRSTRNLLFQAMLVLEDYRPSHLGVDVARFHDELSTYAERVEEQKEREAGWFDRWLTPRIRLLTNRN
jgi:predicted metal-dependent hydrolase